MTGFLLATVLAYSFHADTRLDYSVKVNFDGFLPVMGGNEGKVDIAMGIAVQGVGREGDSWKASSEITEFEIVFNGAKLPLDTSNVVEYFPKTTITVAPQGKILTTDAPDKKLPVRLPGLDVKHLPDITYVPVELPVEEIETGKSWSFTRDFGGAPIQYTCSAESQEGDVWKLKVKLEQTYTVLESPTLTVVTRPEEAVSEVTTKMTGEGTVEFDTARGRVERAEMLNKAVSDVKDLKTGELKQRALSTQYLIELKSKPIGARRTRTTDQGGDFWSDIVRVAQGALDYGRHAVGWIQTAALFGLNALPRQFEKFRPLLQPWLPWID